jgi:hypothetical protein
MKRLLIGITVAALASASISTAFADQTSDDTATAQKAAAQAKKDSDKATHDAKKAAGHAKAAIDADAAGQKQATTTTADADKQAVDQQTPH